MCFYIRRPSDDISVSSSLLFLFFVFCFSVCCRQGNWICYGRSIVCYQGASSVGGCVCRIGSRFTTWAIFRSSFALGSCSLSDCKFRILAKVGQVSDSGSTGKVRQ